MLYICVYLIISNNTLHTTQTNLYSTIPQAASTAQCKHCSVQYLALPPTAAFFISYCTVLQAELFRAFTLVGRSVINGGYPVYFLPLGRVGVTITTFSSIHVLITGPALYKTTPP